MTLPYSPIRMVTGDHPHTAAFIAKETNITGEGDILPPGTIMAASEFDAIPEAQLDDMRSLPRVVARCSPATKVRETY